MRHAISSFLILVLSLLASSPADASPPCPGGWSSALDVPVPDVGWALWSAHVPAYGGLYVQLSELVGGRNAYAFAWQIDGQPWQEVGGEGDDATTGNATVYFGTPSGESSVTPLAEAHSDAGLEFWWYPSSTEDANLTLLLILGPLSPEGGAHSRACVTGGATIASASAGPALMAHARDFGGGASAGVDYAWGAGIADGQSYTARVSDALTGFYFDQPLFAEDTFSSPEGSRSAMGTVGFLADPPGDYTWTLRAHVSYGFDFTFLGADVPLPGAQWAPAPPSSACDNQAHESNCAVPPILGSPTIAIGNDADCNHGATTLVGLTDSCSQVGAVSVTGNASCEGGSFLLVHRGCGTEGVGALSVTGNASCSWGGYGTPCGAQGVGAMSVAGNASCTGGPSDDIGSCGFGAGGVGAASVLGDASCSAQAESGCGQGGGVGAASVAGDAECDGTWLSCGSRGGLGAASAAGRASCSASGVDSCGSEGVGAVSLAGPASCAAARGYSCGDGGVGAASVLRETDCSAASDHSCGYLGVGAASVVGGASCGAQQAGSCGNDGVGAVSILGDASCQGACGSVGASHGIGAVTVAGSASCDRALSADDAANASEAQCASARDVALDAAGCVAQPESCVDASPLLAPLQAMLSGDTICTQPGEPSCGYLGLGPVSLAGNATCVNACGMLTVGAVAPQGNATCTSQGAGCGYLGVGATSVTGDATCASNYCGVLGIAATSATGDATCSTHSAGCGEQGIGATSVTGRASCSDDNFGCGMDGAGATSVTGDAECTSQASFWSGSSCGETGLGATTVAGNASCAGQWGSCGESGLGATTVTGDATCVEYSYGCGNGGIGATSATGNASCSGGSNGYACGSGGIGALTLAGDASASCAGAHGCGSGAWGFGAVSVLGDASCQGDCGSVGGSGGIGAVSVLGHASCDRAFTLADAPDAQDAQCVGGRDLLDEVLMLA